MGTTPVLKADEFFGCPLYLDVDCPTCGYVHPCDAICLRFSPRIFFCPVCKVQKKHLPIQYLLKQYQVRQLLRGLTTP